MSVTDGRDVSAAVLRALEWEQGSLVPEQAGALPMLTWSHPRTQALKAAKKAVAAERQRTKADLHEPFSVPRSPRQGDRLVVITHTCDIVKDAESFPQVEVARVFTTDNTTVITESHNRESARYFRLNPIDETPALILDFRWRTFLDK